MPIKSIAKDEFQAEVIDYKGVVLVDFYADWCGPCKMMSPIITELAHESPELKVVKINVDQNQELATQYSIFSIPTFIIFKDGKVVHQLVGGMSKENFMNEIKKITG